LRVVQVLEAKREDRLPVLVVEERTVQPARRVDDCARSSSVGELDLMKSIRAGWRVVFLRAAEGGTASRGVADAAVG